MTEEGPQQRRLPAWAGLAVIAAVAILLPLPLLLHDGWPRTHEKFAALERIEGFRRAFAAGIFYPVWTPFAGWGWGSPWPLLYHRLYPTIGALLTFATGSVLTTFKLLIVLLLFGTGTGMRRLLRVAGVSDWLAAAGAVALMASPYVLTEWIVRNAMAEFTALMLLPWLYAELALLSKGQRRWVPLGIGIVLLFHAHSLICYFFLLSLLVFLLMHFRLLARLRQEWRQALLAVAIVVIGIVPQVIVASHYLPYFNVEALTDGRWRVDENYHPLASLFADPFDWLTWQQEKLSVELNRYVWLGLAIVIAAMTVTDRWRVKAPLLAFMTVWGTICLFLQMPDFVWVFRVLPKAEFLQFPWRLLSFLSIAAIFVLAVWLDATWRQEGWLRPAAGGVAIGVVVLTLLDFGTVPMRRHDVENFSGEKLANKVANLDGPNSFGEYLLPGMGKELPLPPPKQPMVKGDCADKVNVPPAFEATGVTIAANLGAPCRLSIRQFQTPLLSVDVQNGQVVSPTPSDAIAVELKAGESRVRLRTRSFLELLKDAL